MSTYWWVNISCISLPLLASFHPKIGFYRQFKPAFTSIFLVALVFVIWDIWYTSEGVWGFNPLHLAGHSIAGLPLEEIAFFVFIPFACLFTYQVIADHINVKSKPWFNRIMTTMGVVQVLLGAWFISNWYTGPVWMASGAVLIFVFGIKQVKWGANYAAAYALLLIPFLISNGVLTGSWIVEEVVWYNPQQILGFRVGTVPIEDFSYMNIMLLPATYGYEMFKASKFRRVSEKTQATPVSKHV